ncbi:MAG: cytochrome c family protein [Spirochaetes bacterium]|jgi:hypothetical protein|nr:cytochrome c family protein [Spirochaetota bacterium]
MKKRFVAILTIAMFVLPVVVLAGGPAQDLKVTKIGTTKGAATYSHPKHEKAGVKECEKCHHKGNQSDSCSKCHKGADGMKAMHKNCKDCHVKMNKGPKGCNDCHAKK